VNDGGRPTGVIPVLTSVVRAGWTTSVFGIVAPGELRRRPSDIARVVGSVLLLALLAAMAGNGSAVEEKLLDLLSVLPGVLVGVAQATQYAATAGAVALLVISVVARRPRLVFTLLLGGVVAFGVAAALDAVVHPDADLLAAGRAVRDHEPDFPVVALATSLAVLRAARPYLTRPARRLLEVLVWLGVLGAAYLSIGIPGSLIATIALAWGSAAIAHLTLGSPGGTPSTAQVRGSLADLGVEVGTLELSDDQDWGRVNFVADDDLSIEVIGRDTTDAKLIAKLWRFVWYKDAGPTLIFRREQQLEHDALVLLLAERSGAVVPHLVAVGTAGARDDALLVSRNPAGPALADLPPAALDAGVLDAAWDNLARLHAAGIAHGEPTTARCRLTGDGVVGLVRLEQAETSAAESHLQLDRVHLLASTAEQVGVDAALAAARRRLGQDGVAELLPLLEPAALTARSRDQFEDPKALLADLRGAGESMTGTAIGEPTALRRFSLKGILLAAAFALGVYLLVAQLSDVAAMGDIFAGASWAWVAVTFLLSQIPQFWLAIAMLGAVAAPLPLGQVVMVQFANAFTGLIGGTAGNATLVIRFFQRHGLPASVSVSSGLLNSAAGFLVQITLVLTGLLVVGSSFDETGGGVDVPGWLIALVVGVAVAAVIGALIPKIRARVRKLVESQVRAAIDNLKHVLSTPRKAVQLFGGNLMSQLFFAFTLGAALHAYGASLPLAQIIVINAFASFVGGAAPVPGGMGVVEAGLIGGFTAAGVSEVDAVAATFTARMCTAYLPPIWGWFAFQWLRHHELV
jgi:uncharacterized membrane protein YbhN (UPF0104 family)